MLALIGGYNSVLFFTSKIIHNRVAPRHCLASRPRAMHREKAFHPPRRAVLRSLRHVQARMTAENPTKPFTAVLTFA